MPRSNEAAREKRLRRLLEKQGYSLTKNRSRNPDHPGYRHYMIVDSELNGVVTGHMPFPFSFNLDQVEGWLQRHKQA